MFQLIQPSTMQTYVLPGICAAIIILALPLVAGCILIVERKTIAEVGVGRDNPGVSSHSLLQPIGDLKKLLLAEDLTPPKADRLIFWVAPLVSLLVAMSAFSVLPVGPAFRVVDLNIGLLFILGIGSLGVFGVLLGGWAANTRDSLTRALGIAAGVISYQTATVLGLLSALLLSGSLSVNEIAQAQLDRGQWFIFYVPVGFAVYFLGSLAVTNWTAVDSTLADTETIAECGVSCMTAYTGFRRCLYVLAGYTNMIVVAFIATIVFLGGWLRPAASYRDRFPGTSVELLDVLPAVVMIAAGLYCFLLARKLSANIQRTGAFFAVGVCVAAAALLAGSLFAPESFMQGVHGAFWFMVKVGAYIYSVFWFRFVFSPAHLGPGRRLDWRILIPVAFVNLLTAAVAILTSQDTGLPMRLTTVLATLATLAFGWWLFRNTAREPAVLTADGEPSC
jgi:NADH-quinone oxidoreductase subunit H